MIVVSDTSPLTALLITEARTVLDRLEKEAGMYLSTEIREQALKSVGE